MLALDRILRSEFGNVIGNVSEILTSLNHMIVVDHNILIREPTVITMESPCNFSVYKISSCFM
jgi:hypothetical protein